MKYKINFLPVVNHDLLEIDEYLSQFYENTPDKFFKDFHKKLKLLEDTPRMFAVWADNPAYRKFIVGHYLAFYKVEDDNRTVVIYRVIYGRRVIKPDDV